MLNREYAINRPEQARLEVLRHEGFLRFNELGVDHFFSTSNFGHIDIDKPETHKNIRKILNNPEARIVFAGQPHGKEIRVVDGSQSIVYGCDGLVTFNKNVVLVIRTADCLPILFVALQNKNVEMIGALHAGREGLRKGIINEFGLLLSNEQINPKNVYVLIGPHICGKCYSLNKDDVRTISLIEEWGEKYFSDSKNNLVFLNMSEFVRDQMINNGILPGNIFTVPFCTYENHNIFPSYRKNQEDGNRESILFASAIVLS